MILEDFELAENVLRKEKIINPKAGTIISIILLLITDAKKILFPKGEYRKLKIYHPRRIWRLAQVAITLINTIIGITRR